MDDGDPALAGDRLTPDPVTTVVAGDGDDEHERAAVQKETLGRCRRPVHRHVPDAPPAVAAG